MYVIWAPLIWRPKVQIFNMSYTKTRETSNPSQGRAREKVRAQQKLQKRLHRCEKGHANIQDKACCKGKHNGGAVCNLQLWSDTTVLEAIRVYVNALPEADMLAFILERRLVNQDIYTSANRSGSARHRRMHQCYLEPPDELRRKLLDLSGSDVFLNTMAVHQATTEGRRITSPKALIECCQPFLIRIVAGRSKHSSLLINRQVPSPQVPLKGCCRPSAHAR